MGSRLVSRPRLLVCLASPIDGAGQRLATLSERLASFRRRLRRAGAALARLLAQVVARVATAGRRVQQRHRRAAHSAQKEGEKNISRSGSVIACHVASTRNPEWVALQLIPNPYRDV